MKIITTAAFVLAAGLAVAPAMAQAQSAAPVQGSQPIPGEGPGGSGAGESTKGLGKDQPSAASGTMGTMMKKPGMAGDGSAMGAGKLNGTTTTN
jgi:hypothetical protein